MPPMTRRRSARIASASKQAHALPPTNLGSVIERDETADDLPQVPPASADPHVAVPRTPASSSPTKPSNSEMHPSKTHVSLAPPSSAVRLGFGDIPSARRDSARKSAVKKPHEDVEDSAEATAAKLQATPSKVGTAAAAAPPSSSFTFRYTRNGEPGATTPAGLSQEARRMMEELREKTTMIRADLEVERAEERAKAEADANGRRIAKPKSRSGRFSAAHTAEFEKMESIANHPSAFRAAPGRFTPVKATTPATAIATATATASTGKRGLKRTQSKASLLDETPKKAAAPTPAPASAKAQPQSQLHNHSPSTVKRLFASLTHRKEEDKTAKAGEDREPTSPAKRMKQNQGDDTSSGRPITRDGSALPRPAAAVGSATPSRKTGIARSRAFASLMTPTKSSLSRSTVTKTPVGAKTPSMPVSALKKPVFGNIQQTPSAAGKVKPTPTVRLVEGDSEKQDGKDSKNQGHAVANTVAKRCALPVPKLSFSKTPGPSRVQKALASLPVVPATTPSRKPVKHVTFTPTTERAVYEEKSPSLFRSQIPRSGTARPGSSHKDEQPAAGMASTVTAQESPSVRRFGAVLYPDLSKHHLLLQSEETNTQEEQGGEEEVVVPTEAVIDQEPSVPGAFTFRSDKTISFGEKPVAGFGASPGQATVRHVRMSVPPEKTSPMPGSFSKLFTQFRTKVATKGADKENTEPVPVPVNIPHGIANKKRHRVSEADEVAEEAAAERAAKRRKNEPVAEGEALMAPRLMTKPENVPRLITKWETHRPQLRHTSVVRRTPVQTPSPEKKKRMGMSMSRLNSLAQPKHRK